MHSKDIRLNRRMLNVSEYHQLNEAGILLEDERVGLLQGEIIQMSPIDSKHANCVKKKDKSLFS